MGTLKRRVGRMPSLSFTCAKYFQISIPSTWHIEHDGINFPRCKFKEVAHKNEFTIQDTATSEWAGSHCFFALVYWCN